MDTSDQSNTAPTTVTEWSSVHSIPHDDAADIIRQVEYYFSDENLPQDAHLLGMTGGDGNGPASLSQIMNFSKMKCFRPMSRVREALRSSELIEVVDNKHIKRRFPLTRRLLVVPRVDEQRRKKAELQEQMPWMTKGMLKPTGFEVSAIEALPEGEELEREQRAYDPEEDFSSRIEYAINKFNNRRKMHQHTRAIFVKFMTFGGIESGMQQFAGGRADKKQLKKQGLDEEEIIERTAQFGLSERVIAGLDVYTEEATATYIVDFVGVAKGFLSSHILSYNDWYDEQYIRTACNVLRNFYNYLDVHRVCPEYAGQIEAVRDICDQAEEELMKLAAVDQALPGDFNLACSTLYDGSWANSRAGSDGWDDEPASGLSLQDAKTILMCGVFAHGTDEQMALAEKETEGSTVPFRVVSEELLGLTVIGVDMAEEETKAVYADDKLAGTHIKPMGKLICGRWEVPFAPRFDLPASSNNVKPKQRFTFIVEEATLKNCVLGMKLEVVVKELDVGIAWIDRVEAIYPSFFTWLLNERIREWKEPGPPRKMKSTSMVVKANTNSESFDQDEIDSDCDELD